MNTKITNFANINTNMIKSIFLLFLAVSGNYVGSTLSCKTQWHMSNNMVIKQMIIVMMIYFTLNITSSDNPYPIEVAKKTLFIWITYIILSKTDSRFTLTGIILLIAFYVLTNFSDYENGQLQSKIENSLDNKEKIIKIHTDKISMYEKGQQLLFFIFIGVVIIGFLIYMTEKRKEYGSKFNFSTFLLGVVECKNT